MKCYNHPGDDAVALCKACCRALCKECIVEVGPACSCRNRCEAEVAAIADLFQRNRSVYVKTSTSLFRSGLFMVAAGLLFLLLGLYGFFLGGRPEASLLGVIMGAIFSGWGISYFFSARRMKEK